MPGSRRSEIQTRKISRLQRLYMERTRFISAVEVEKVVVGKVVIGKVVIGKVVAGKAKEKAVVEPKR